MPKQAASESKKRQTKCLCKLLRPTLSLTYKLVFLFFIVFYVIISHFKLVILSFNEKCSTVIKSNLPVSRALLYLLNHTSLLGGGFSLLLSASFENLHQFDDFPASDQKSKAEEKKQRHNPSIVRRTHTLVHHFIHSVRLGHILTGLPHVGNPNPPSLSLPHPQFKLI
jgi:hypothetical protein